MRSLIVFAAFLAVSCDAIQWGLPQIAVSATSPDGRYVAFVRNHPSLDPPEQSIWIRDQAGHATKIRKLGGDTQWCTRIIWSPDSSTATFVVQSTAPSVEHVQVDARTHKVVR